MISDEEDEALVRRAQRGDTLAFDTLVVRHRPRVLRYCTRLLACEPEAEELTQDVFVLAWRYLARFQLYAPFGNWLMRIATNSCLNLLRTQKGKDLLNGLSTDDPNVKIFEESGFLCVLGVDETVIRSVAAEQWWQAIRHCACTVKPHWDELDWHIFSLMYDDDIEEKREVARRLQLSENTVKYRIYRHIRPTLRAAAKQVGEELKG